MKKKQFQFWILSLVLLTSAFFSPLSFAPCSVCGSGSLETTTTVFFTDNGCNDYASGCVDTAIFAGCTRTKLTPCLSVCAAMSFDAMGVKQANCYNAGCGGVCTGISEFPSLYEPLIMLLLFGGVYVLLGIWKKRKLQPR